MLSDVLDPDKSDMEAGCSTAQKGHEQEPAVNEGEEITANIDTIQYPTDASHVEAFHIRCNNSYISMCSINQIWSIQKMLNTYLQMIQFIVLVVCLPSLKKSRKAWRIGEKVVHCT